MSLQLGSWDKSLVSLYKPLVLINCWRSKPGKSNPCWCDVNLCAFGGKGNVLSSDTGLGRWWTEDDFHQVVAQK